MTAKHTTYKLIDTSGALRKLMDRLAGHASLALDMEMENHYHHYGLHIALVQIATADGMSFIIDPLAGIDPCPLGELLADPDRELILHDADFDRRAAHQVYGWRLGRVFDTKIAAQLCGIRRFGLANLLSEFFGITVNKRFQTTNWMKRPLPEGALDYAAADTAHLHALRDLLKTRLEQLGRLDWAMEEFAYAARPRPPEPEPRPHHQIKRSSLLNPRQQAVLECLADFRDRLARQLNRPRHYIMRNDTLLQLAAADRLSIRQLNKLRGVHPSLLRRQNLQDLLAAWENGRQAVLKQAATPRARRPRAGPGGRQKLKAMQQWRGALAAELDLEPYLVLPNDVLEWCANNPDRALPPGISAMVRHWQSQLCWPGMLQAFNVPAPAGGKKQTAGPQ